MTRRDLMKAAAALAALPSMLGASLRDAFAARREIWAETGAMHPVPVYAYDSRSRRMTFWRADEGTRAMHAYLSRSS